ncbi:hypothetical protein SAMN05444172_2572 [Burkholderia sp. GAS332]|nr:hypothetical protein SAMN05444172_2572 [Burkholderia sp. GAS332]
MAGYYGIADFADGFNNVRDNALDSGFRAKQRMRDDWLGDYRMPGQMLGADADALANGIKNDTLNQGYDSMVQYGVNNANLNAQKSGINLDKLAADETMTRLTNEARAAGHVNPSDIATYIRSNIEPDQLSANQHLGEALRVQEARAAQQSLNLGAALGGNLGQGYENAGLQGLGYGITADSDQNGNQYFQGPDGQRSSAVSLAGQVPLAAAFSGDVNPAMTYYTGREAAVGRAAQETARLRQLDSRYASQNDTRDQQTMVRALTSQHTQLMTSARALAKTDPVGTNRMMQQARAVQAQLDQIYGLTGDTPTGLTSDSMMDGTGSAGGSAGGSQTGSVANPFSGGGTAAYGAGAPAAGSAKTVMGGGAVAPAISAAVHPAVAAAGHPAAQPAPDPQRAFDMASASYDKTLAALRKLEADAGGVSVYGPRNPMPGFGKAHEALTAMLGEAQKRRASAKQALGEATYNAGMQRQWEAQNVARTNDAAATEVLLKKYLGGPQ